MVSNIAQRASAEAPRLLFPTPRSDFRLSWHSERDTFVVSLWHKDECVASAPLSAAEAAEVASFIVTQLGERAAPRPRLVAQQ